MVRMMLPKTRKQKVQYNGAVVVVCSLILDCLTCIELSYKAFNVVVILIHTYIHSSMSQFQVNVYTTLY